MTHDHPSLGTGGVPVAAGPFGALVIGASFGGPKAVAQILAELPADFPLPVAVVQHTTPGMTESWAASLSAKCRIPVVEAKTRSRFEPGVVHIAPARLQMRFVPGARMPLVRLEEDRDGSTHVPSVDVLFASAAAIFGSRTIAVLLTGLGRDGAEGMLSIRQAGGYTIAESEDTAVAFGMPGSAYRAGGVVEQLPLPRIGRRVIELTRVRGGAGRAT